MSWNVHVMQDLGTPSLQVNWFYWLITWRQKLLTLQEASFPSTSSSCMGGAKGISIYDAAQLKKHSHLWTNTMRGKKQGENVWLAEPGLFKGVGMEHTKISRWRVLLCIQLIPNEYGLVMYIRMNEHSFSGINLDDVYTKQLSAASGTEQPTR